MFNMLAAPMARVGRPQRGPMLDRPDHNTHSPGENIRPRTLSRHRHHGPRISNTNSIGHSPIRILATVHCKFVCKSKKRQSRSFFKNFPYYPCAVRNHYGRPSACGRPVDTPSTQGKAPRVGRLESSAEPFAATDQTFFHMTRGTCGRNFLNRVAERSGQR